MEKHDAMLIGILGLLFVASVAGTIQMSASMAGGMPMPGGWTMSMAWMRMPGQTSTGAAGSFVTMWTVMMVAMMLPSLVPMLARYRRAVRRADGTRATMLTALAGAGYFFVWALLGAVVFALAIPLTSAEMQSHTLARAVPLGTGLLVVLAGWVQLTEWKGRLLARCQDEPACRPARTGAAREGWLHGLRLGVLCSLCCSGLMVILIVIGVMDLRIMAVVAAAITLERLAPRPYLVGRATGVVAIAAGAFAIARALGMS